MKSGWISSRGWIVVLVALLASALVWLDPVQADGKWEQVSTPNTNGGLVITPNILDSGRLLMTWGWSSGKMEVPEYAFSTMNGDSWTEPRVPFFGDNVGNVRRLATATAKYTTGLIYQRTTEQDDDAFEVLYCISVDKGWSYTDPRVVDSFVHEEKGGTAVNIAGIGGRRPTFAFGWLSEARQVKTAILDPGYVGDRPRANNMGRYGLGCERIELAGEESGGFVSVWNEGSRLMSGYLRPLSGTAEESQLVQNGKVGLNFAMCDNKGRNPVLVFDLNRAPSNGGSRRQVRAWKDGQWNTVAAAAPSSGDFPVSLQIDACQDSDRNLHVVSLARNGESLTYSALKDNRFGEPETVCPLRPVIGITGMGIVAYDKYVYVVVSQGPYVQLWRRCRK